MNFVRTPDYLTRQLEACALIAEFVDVFDVVIPATFDARRVAADVEAHAQEARDPDVTRLKLAAAIEELTGPLSPVQKLSLAGEVVATYVRIRWTLARGKSVPETVEMLRATAPPL